LFVCVWLHVWMRNAVCLNMRIRSQVNWMDMSVELGFHNSYATVYRENMDLGWKAIDFWTRFYFTIAYTSIYKLSITTQQAKPTGISVSIKCKLPF